MTDHEWRTAASEPVSRVARSRLRLRSAGAHRRPARAGLPRWAASGNRPRCSSWRWPPLTVAGGIATAAVIPPGTNGPGLTTVGPVSATDGFPVWYKDKAGLRLENCISQADPLCPAFGALPDPTAPISFPDNYPDEGFYSLANANLNTGNAGKALLVVALEQAFRSGPVARRRPGHLRPAAVEDHQRDRRRRLQVHHPGRRQDAADLQARVGVRHRGHRDRRPGRLHRRARRPDRSVPDLGHLPDRPGAEAGAPVRTPTSATVPPCTRSTAAPTAPTSSASKGPASTRARRSTPAPPSPARSRTASKPTCSPCRASWRPPAA